MEITPGRLREAERSHGLPREAFIRHDDSLALVHKPSDPPGAFWARAGGVGPGETLDEGARREAWEETGLEVEVERYVLREVERAAWVTLQEFRTDVVPILRSSGWGRYEYRLHLARMVFEELGLDPLELVSE